MLCRELHATVDFLNKRERKTVYMVKITKRARKTGRQEHRVKKKPRKMMMMKKKRGVVSRSPMRKANRKARRSTKKGRRR